MIHCDKDSQKLRETQQEVQGLPIKYTNAPRFVFLNEHAKESGEKQEEETQDEFADIY